MKKKDMPGRRVWRLADEATEILRSDHQRGGPWAASIAIDLLNPTDTRRRDWRRKQLLTRNKIAAERFISTAATPSPEEILFKKQRHSRTTSVLREVFDHFENDIPVKLVLLACLKRSIKFRSTKELAKACQMTEAQITTAKERIKYLIQKDGKHLTFESFLNDFKGGE